jgi:glutamate-ammonia-ligase adenylyltransferase
MSLPPLTTLPATLQGLAARAQTAWPAAVEALAGRCTERFARWPAARLECLGRVFAASDFVFEQAMRDPLMLLDLADSGELERSLTAGELRAQLQVAVDACGDEDELGRCLRRLRNRQQTRIIWRDVCRLTDLRETCNDLTLLA